jgi:hypothetical protein
MEWHWIRQLWDLFHENRTDILGVVAFIGGVKFLYEYSRENRRKRMEIYTALREEFREDRNLEIWSLLDQYRLATESEKVQLSNTIALIPWKERYRFAVLLEHVATMMNSGMIKPSVAASICGYYAVECWNTPSFWIRLRQSKEDYGWVLLNNFVLIMEREITPPLSRLQENKWLKMRINHYPRLKYFLKLLRKRIWERWVGGPV